MIPIVGVSLEEALLGFGGDGDAELHEKSVFFSLAMITASETGIFEYDPQDEPPSGRPPGPWDGYNFFTVDLSTVKDNIEDMLARIAELEYELEEMQECCDEVVDVIHLYDEDYDPHPDPPDPTNPTIPEKIQEIIDDESGFTFEPNPDDPDFPDDIMVIANGANVTDETTGVSLGVEITLDERNRGTAYPYYTSGGTKYYMGGVSANFVSYWGEHNIKVIDPTTGEYSGGARAYWTYGGSSWFPFGGTQAELIGYGDPTHSYTISK